MFADPNQLPDYPGGVIAGLITAVTALVLGLTEYLRRQWSSRKTVPSQLDRIEEMLSTLVRTLVVATEDGGKTTVGRQLAKGLQEKLESIERQIARRGNQRSADNEKIEQLCRNVESLTDAVMSAVDMVRENHR